MNEIEICGKCGIIRPCVCEEKKMEHSREDMNNLFYVYLQEHVEYSVICEECYGESTRDSLMAFAMKHAEGEGFEIVGDLAFCKQCKGLHKAMNQHEKDCRCEGCESSRIDAVMAAEKERPDFEERLQEATTLTAVRFDFRRREREAK